MQEKINLEENIDHTFSITPIILKKEKVNLFYSKEEKVFYSFYTDGDFEHLNTWIDKRPFDRDIFLKGCSTVKRFEFFITNANLLLVEKKYQNKLVRNLYINQEYLYKVINNQLYQVSINQQENLMIKKMVR